MSSTAQLGQAKIALALLLRMIFFQNHSRKVYLAVGTEIDEHTAHAYVSAILPAKDGSWRLQKLEKEAVTQNEDQLSQLVGSARQTNKWGWLALKLEDSLTDLTNEDVDIFGASGNRVGGVAWCLGGSYRKKRGRHKEKRSAARVRRSIGSPV